MTTDAFSVRLFFHFVCLFLTSKTLIKTKTEKSILQPKSFSVFEFRSKPDVKRRAKMTCQTSKKSSFFPVILAH
jgi:hypothetical protein